MSSGVSVLSASFLDAASHDVMEAQEPDARPILIGDG